VSKQQPGELSEQDKSTLTYLYKHDYGTAAISTARESDHELSGSETVTASARR
jgi:hypothetical protein